MKTMLATAVLMMSIMVSSADASYTVGRPIDNWLGNYFDHTYSTYDDWTCLESFGGGCDCAGSSSCYWYTHGYGAGSCTNSWFGNWTYAVSGVCHQAANQVARHHNGGIMGYGVRGMSWSIGLWGDYGSGSLC